jgi:hypothetical protein
MTKFEFLFVCLLFKCYIKCGVAWRVISWWLITSLHSFITKHWGFFACFDFSTLKTITVLLIIMTQTMTVLNSLYSVALYFKGRIISKQLTRKQIFKNCDISGYMMWISTWGSIGYVQPQLTITQITMCNSLYKWLPNSSLGRKMRNTCTDRYAQSTTKCYLWVTSMEIL